MIKRTVTTENYTQSTALGRKVSVTSHHSESRVVPGPTRKWTRDISSHAEHYSSFRSFVFISIAAMVAASVHRYIVKISSTYRSIRIPSPRICLSRLIEIVNCFLESGIDFRCLGTIPRGPAFRQGHVVINFGVGNTVPILN